MNKLSIAIGLGLLLCVVSCSSFNAAFRKRISKEDDEYFTAPSGDKLSVEQTIGAIRGYLAGYQAGFYNKRRFQISEKCFGDESIDEVIYIENYLSKGGFSHFLPFLKVLSGLLDDNLNNCGYE